MKIFNKFLVLCIAAFFISCDTDPILSEANVVSFEESSKSLAIDVGSSVSDQFSVFTGGITGADRTYNLIVEGATIPLSGLDMPATVVVPGGSNEGIVNFTVNYNDEFSITGGSFNVILEDTSTNLIGNSEISIDVNVTCESPASIDFEFDGYASEITWSVIDSDDNTIYSGGGYSDGLATFSREVCLADGDYTFVIDDSFGDGLSFPNIGNATLTFKGEVLAEAVGDFGSQFVGEFTIAN
jgi:hypothetical protein